MATDDLMMGQLIAGLAQNTNAVKDLADNVKELTQAHGSHATQLAELSREAASQSDELKEIKKTISSNEYAKQLLIAMGMTPDSPDVTRGYFDFIKIRMRECATQNKVISGIKVTVLTVLIITAMAFVLNTFVSGLSSKTAQQNADAAHSVINDATSESLIGGGK